MVCILWKITVDVWVGKIYGKEIKTYNPAFDITPSKYITKLITEKGICNADNNSIKKLLKK